MYQHRYQEFLSRKTVGYALPTANNIKNKGSVYYKSFKKKAYTQV